MQYFAVASDRHTKARKIEAVLSRHLGTPGVRGKRILDLGCGSGHIALHFAAQNEVVAADVVRQTTVDGGYRFVQLDSPLLPFAEESFDIVILNHVLCCMPDQLGQLKEVRRVLACHGACYLATANRYFPVEGFTKLPLLHYLPRPLFALLYKRIRKTEVELFPLGHRGVVELIGRAGFSCSEYTARILRNPRAFGEEGLPFGVPVPSCLSPTVIFVLGKGGDSPCR